jgi:hypothetical protein
MTELRYCAHWPCSRVLVQRPKEMPSAFLVRKFCSVSCSNTDHDRSHPHGTLKAFRIHWLRDEKPCKSCQQAVDHELARTARATA